jgi:hypothetical protein
MGSGLVATGVLQSLRPGRCLGLHAMGSASRRRPSTTWRASRHQGDAAGRRDHFDHLQSYGSTARAVFDLDARCAGHEAPATLDGSRVGLGTASFGCGSASSSPYGNRLEDGRSQDLRRRWRDDASLGALEGRTSIRRTGSWQVRFVSILCLGDVASRWPRMADAHEFVLEGVAGSGLR